MALPLRPEHAGYSLVSTDDTRQTTLQHHKQHDAGHLENSGFGSITQDLASLPSINLQSSAHAAQMLTEHERQTYIASAKATRILDHRAMELIRIEADSVYGAALALPQIARSAEWSMAYTSKAVRGLLFLLTNIFLQGFLLYMLSKEERAIDKFGGQMYLCNFGAHLSNCPDAPNCIGPGGTRYTPSRLFNWDLWTTRVFIRDSLKLIFPERADEIQAKVDPGEYGLESYYLRMSCCFLFVLGLWNDLAGSWDIALLLWRVPTRAEDWIQHENVKATDDGGKKACVDTTGSTDESFDLGFVNFRVCGMPFHWKVISFFIVLVPKVYLWLLTVDIGIVFLMETSTIESMIINCVALGFILSIDELTMSILSPQSREILNVIEPYACSEPNVPEDDELHAHLRDKNWNALSPWFYVSIIPTRLAAMLAVTAFFVTTYYLEHCQRLSDGSWVARDLHLPRSESVSFLSFLFGPFPNVFPIDSEPSVYWTMPDALDDELFSPGQAGAT